MGHRIRTGKAKIPEAIKNILGITDEDVVFSYDHCNSAEEIEIEMLADYLRRGMREERAKGTAILLASHDMSEVEELADRVAILVKGRIVAEGTPNEIITSGDSNVKIYVKTLKDALSDIKLERAQATSEGYVVFDTEDIEDTVGLILSHIKSKGDKLMDLRIERPSLEERFINITRNGGIQ